MGTSQFTRYCSIDPGAPTLNGQAGSLITVLNYILVGGQPNLITGSGNNAAGIAYGTTPSVGWTSPYTGTNGAAYKLSSTPAAGCSASTGFYLLVNDNLSAMTIPYTEAQLCGYETLGSYFALPYNSANTLTAGGPFPAQVNAQGSGGYGYQVIRKSVTNNTLARYWVIYADGYTLYFFMQSEANPNAYYGFIFGDFYSFAGTSDAYRCCINGRNINNSGSLSYEGFDIQSIITNYTGYPQAYGTASLLAPRSWSGTGNCIGIGKHGDVEKAGLNTNYGALTGIIQTPNSADNSLYLSPIWITEPTGNIVRGYMRGMWHLCHPIANFTDGQIITGVGTNSGKTFQVIKPTPAGASIAIETSATVLTN